MTGPAVAQEPRLVVLVQPDGALVRAESVLGDGQDEVGVVVIDLFTIVPFR